MVLQPERQDLYFRRKSAEPLQTHLPEAVYVLKMLGEPLRVDDHILRQRFQEYAYIAGKSIVMTENNQVNVQTSCDPDYITHAMKLIGYERVIRD